MAKEKISNYRLAQSVKKDLKIIGFGNESEGIRLAVKLFKKIGLREARKKLEEK